MSEQDETAGRGGRFATIVTLLAGISALVATLVTFLSVWLQSKNYRKPLLQRYVIRILIMVPVYSAASWASLTSLKVAFWIDPFRDVYEAFTLYAFFQLLINFLGGERSLIIMMHGRAPVSHLWPLNHCFSKVDISDPYTFLAVKRGILQYAWIKPLLAISTIAMQATGTYHEGYLGLSSGYLWSGIIYNVSITVSLYALALFWVCMSKDLQPFRPMPKFLCIKGIIFASYWQGFFLSILVWLGAIPDLNAEYSADNLAAAIQDALICFEMPIFAASHWYAFSWHDYTDKTISDARMPVKYALRDAFGPRDLIEDAKETFFGTKYEYRNFDAEDNVITHEDSSSREARIQQGMRYERGGRGKYWLPEAGTADAKTPLLPKLGGSRARAMSPGANKALGNAHEQRWQDYDTTSIGQTDLDEEDESLYEGARELEFGDWNYPVINTHFATKNDILTANPDILTVSTNRNLLQPTKHNRQRRKQDIEDVKQSVADGKQRGESSSSGGKSGKAVKRPESNRGDSSTSSASGSSQLVDIVVEDSHAADVERVRARKEGGPGWNNTDQKHFVNTYTADDEEAVHEGYHPDIPTTQDNHTEHNLDAPFTVGEDEDDENQAGDKDALGRDQPWDHRNYGRNDANSHDYGNFSEERSAWKGKSGENDDQ